MNKIKPFSEEERLQYLEKVLSDEEALELAKRFNIKNFSLEMTKNQKVRVKVSSLCCPICQSKNISVDTIKINNSDYNDNHRMVCNSCDNVVTLWNVALSDHYRI